MRTKLIRIALVVALIALPFGIRAVYLWMTAWPKKIVIAGGPAEGQYRRLSESLARAIESKDLGVSVEVRATRGSLENLELLRSGAVHFALYQPGTSEAAAGPAQKENGQVAFIANVYSEVVHFIVRRDAGISGPDDLPEMRVALGQKDSGDYASSKVLLKHFGLTEQMIKPRYLNYTDLRRAFAESKIDAAFVTAGIQAPIFRELCESGRCVILNIPYTRALAMKNSSLSPYTIPQGLYRSTSPPEPAGDIKTVSLRAQLLTRSNVSRKLVNEITKIILGEKFLKDNNLAELVRDGASFARANSEFDVHVGARDFYDPELRPVLNPDFVEATEGMRSFVVSVLIACFLLLRWMKERRARQKEHRLDRYIRKLLEIEQNQLELDDRSDSDDAGALQKMLDDVTFLRREALSEFSAHELKEDRATDCFLEMCHSLSDKINAKLSRQRLDQRMNELVAAVNARHDSERD